MSAVGKSSLPEQIKNTCLTLEASLEAYLT